MAGDKYVVAIELRHRRGWTDWIRPTRRNYKLVCCDCGLIHSINYRVRDGHIEYQARRDMRATGQRRRWLKHKET